MIYSQLFLLGGGHIEGMGKLWDNKMKICPQWEK